IVAAAEPEHVAGIRRADRAVVKDVVTEVEPERLVQPCEIADGNVTEVNILSSKTGWLNDDLIGVAGRRSGYMKPRRGAAGQLVGGQIDELVELVPVAGGGEFEGGEPVDGGKAEPAGDVEIDRVDLAVSDCPVPKPAMQLEAGE